MSTTPSITNVYNNKYMDNNFPKNYKEFITSEKVSEESGVISIKNANLAERNVTRKLNHQKIKSISDLIDIIRDIILTIFSEDYKKAKKIIERNITNFVEVRNNKQEKIQKVFHDNIISKLRKNLIHSECQNAKENNEILNDETKNNIKDSIDEFLKTIDLSLAQKLIQEFEANRQEVSKPEKNPALVEDKKSRYKEYDGLEEFWTQHGEREENEYEGLSDLFDKEPDNQPIKDKKQPEVSNVPSDEEKQQPVKKTPKKVTFFESVKEFFANKFKGNGANEAAKVDKVEPEEKIVQLENDIKAQKATKENAEEKLKATTYQDEDDLAAMEQIIKDRDLEIKKMEAELAAEAAKVKEANKVKLTAEMHKLNEDLEAQLETRQSVKEKLKVANNKDVSDELNKIISNCDLLIKDTRAKLDAKSKELAKLN